MSGRSIRVIAAREVRDTLSDWRLLLPIVILSLVFPTVLVSASDIFVRFLESDSVIRAIVPFAMLLVGFIPASFSLITALESFVGERERNSLEALLAMPVSDNELYIGKLLAALLPPLGSALVAMTVFALQMWFQQPALYALGLKPEYIITIMLLLTVKAVLMVAGAVIISSHTSSIRAANLLASFVLLPTAALIQIESLYVIAGRWQDLRIFALALAIIAVVLVRTGMGTFNREEILSRENEQINLRRVWANFRTYLRAYHPVAVPPSQYTERFSLRRFYRHDLFKLLRDYRLPIGVALFAALLGVVGGTLIIRSYQLPWLNSLLANQLGRTAGAGPEFTLGIFFGNVRVSLFSGLLSALTFGLFSVLVPLLTFGQIALAVSFLVSHSGDVSGTATNPLAFLLGYVLPHAIFELPAAVLGAAMGIRLGAALMKSGRGVTVGQNMLWSLAQFLKVWALVLVPLYLVGAIIEGMLVPYLAAALYR